MTVIAAIPALKREWAQSLWLGVGVFSLSMAGILSRAEPDLATFWPANAFALGMLVRFPSLARIASFICIAIGFFMADLLTGSPLDKNLVLNLSNMLAIATGYVLYRPVPLIKRTLQSPSSIYSFLRAIGGAALMAGLTGVIANPLLFGASASEGFVFWSVTELMNYTAFMPLLLTLPNLERPMREWWQSVPRSRIMDFVLPLLALFAAAVGSVLIGGPGAIAFPVPALLWCALVFSPFITACLAFAFGAWTLLATQSGLMWIGVEVDTRETVYSLRICVTLIALAPLVVASVTAARYRLLERLRQLADYDAMTGLHNRRAFLERGASRLNDALKQRKTTAIMMLDIDHFKRVNDTYGHDGGDRVLKTFAGILQKNVRPGDEVGRLGGEEFAVILPDCTEEEAKAIADRLNKVLREAKVSLEDGTDVSATVSIGIHMEQQDKSLEALLNYADKALYAAKTSGRNRYVFSSAPDSSGLAPA